MYYAVIGNNYGDEGKGLAVDHLTLSGHNLVVRHNGGAQAGHTVDKEDRCFVFHELSSGSFNGADTYWANTFFPDLYKLEEEINDFAKVSSKPVKIYASPLCNITLLYDVYINQKREELRGSDKHGSCGMGIWEATKRSLNGFGVTLGEIHSNTVSELAAKLAKIESDYVSSKIAKFGISEELNLDTLEYADILKDALEKHVVLVDDELSFLMSYDNVVFEGGQGLLLDTARDDLWPHTTCSRTNLTNPVMILESHGLKLDEAVYVTRTYLTRHGAGPFNEDPELDFVDETNITNPWQDKMRFGRFESVSSLIERAAKDSRDNCPEAKTALFVTHLNETCDKVLTEEGDIDFSEFTKTASAAGVDKIYCSRSKFSNEVKTE
ncbi:MAG: adenylosuccinate synthetase [Clostridiales bacterium]|nr:adenylosuccinate synthetase [Clostridiales bacterium]